jgi:hypothetical protein
VTARRDRPPVSVHDLQEMRTFRRFLTTVGHDNIWQHPGWVPYALGWGPAPPPGMEDVPVTAWTLPG